MFREKGRGNGQWREASRCEGRRINSKGRKCTPRCTRLGVMKCSLHPVFYVLLGFSLPPLHFAAFTEHSGQVAMNICIQLWPSKATGQFVRHISSPFLYFLSSSLSSFLFSLTLRLLFLPVFRVTRRRRRRRRCRVRVK